MRIGFDARAYGWTGIGRYVRNVLAHVTRQAVQWDLPYRFVVFVPPRFAERVRTLPRTSVVPVRESYYSLYEQTGFLLPLRAARVDLLHFPHFNIPLAYRRPSVVTVHDLTRFRFRGQKRTSRLHQVVYEQVFRNAVGSARQVIAVSGFTARELLHRFPHVAPNVTVIPEGVEEHFSPVGRSDDATFLARLGARGPYLLYVGVWLDHKNLPGLIRAFRRIRDEGYRGHLVITGEGRPWDVDVRGIAQGHGVEDALLLPGVVSDAELAILYRHADAFLFLSLSEGFGLPPLEAMACGTPVVAARAGSLPEVLGDAGLFVDGDDPKDVATAFRVLMEDADVRARCIEKGLARARSFTWEDCARETLRAYAAALSPRSARAGRAAASAWRGKLTNESDVIRDPPHVTRYPRHHSARISH